MTMNIDFDRQFTITPETVYDEKVVIDHELPNGLYAGWVIGLTSEAILGASHATYGVFSQTSRAGQRYTVLAEGTPGANEVTIDRSTGRLVSATPVTVYATYPLYARIFHSAGERLTVPRMNTIHDGSEDTVLCRMQMPCNDAFVAVQVDFEMPSADENDNVLTLLNGETQVAQILVPDLASSTGLVPLDNRATFSKGDVLTLVADASADELFGFTIHLIRG